MDSKNKRPILLATVPAVTFPPLRRTTRPSAELYLIRLRALVAQTRSSPRLIGAVTPVPAVKARLPMRDRIHRRVANTQSFRPFFQALPA